MSSIWNVFIDRSKIVPDSTQEGGYRYDDMPPIVYGPFLTEVEAEAEAQSESGLIHGMITVDCKHEGWNCDDVRWTKDEVPDDAQLSGRDLVMVVQEANSLLEYGGDDGWDQYNRTLLAALEATLERYINQAAGILPRHPAVAEWVHAEDGEHTVEAFNLLTRIKAVLA